MSVTSSLEVSRRQLKSMFPKSKRNSWVRNQSERRGSVLQPQLLKWNFQSQKMVLQSLEMSVLKITRKPYQILVTLTLSSTRGPVRPIQPSLANQGRSSAQSVESFGFIRVSTEDMATSHARSAIDSSGCSSRNLKSTPVINWVNVNWTSEVDVVHVGYCHVSTFTMWTQADNQSLSNTIQSRSWNRRAHSNQRWILS